MASGDVTVTVRFEEDQLAAVAAWMGHLESCLAVLLDPLPHPDKVAEARNALVAAGAARLRLSVSGTTRATGDGLASRVG